MKDYIKLIADKLESNIDVIFYTVGGATFECIRELKHRFGLFPSAVCDGDIKKQGRTYKGLFGISVISSDEAISRYPGAEWFIPSLDYRFQIIGQLTEKQGVLPEKIINYTPVRKIRSCNLLQKLLIYDRDGEMHYCWRKPSPRVDACDSLRTQELLALRNSLIDKMKAGLSLEGTDCANCSQICEDYYPQEPMSWTINYFVQSVCNYKCSYCAVNNNPLAYSDNVKHTLGEVIHAFRSDGLLDEDYAVTLSTAGEPLIHKKRKQFYDVFDGFELVINTNGSIYDNDLFDLMSQKRVLLVISIDAGTRETYRQVKGVDTYGKVRDNLKKYAEAAFGVVALKYVFVPEVNDTPEDIDGFVDFCVNTNSTFVIVSLDYYTMDKISTHTREMISRLKSGLSQRDILCVPYTSCETVEYNAEIRRLLSE